MRLYGGADADAQERHQHQYSELFHCVSPKAITTYGLVTLRRLFLVASVLKEDWVTIEQQFMERIVLVPVDSSAFNRMGDETYSTVSHRSAADFCQDMYLASIRETSSKVLNQRLA